MKASCIPCAKRKVRCDREEPCSSCKKRQKQQYCVYAEIDAQAQIQRLEALVQKLGGDPAQANEASDKTELAIKPREKQSASNDTDAGIVQEDDASVFLETPIWRVWNGKYFGPLRDFEPKGFSEDMVETEERCGVFQTIWSATDSSIHPDQQNAEYLWLMFAERVHPVVKICFDWELASLKQSCITGQTGSLSFREHALIFAMYGITIVSLPDGDRLGTGKEELLAGYHRACEQALLAYNFWVAYDFMTLQTLVLYLTSLFSQHKYSGLWDMMGLLLRKAERAGLHHDGLLLKLTPFETERRRRLWWAIQNLDLAVNSVSGATSMNLLADWDVGLPLNIDDADMSQGLRDMPKEHEGLTSMSHCLWRYWIIQEQRKCTAPNGKRLGMVWTVDRRLSLETRRSIIDKIERDFNQKFLRFCDPIKSLDMLVLIAGRAVVNFLRRATLCPGPAFKEARDFTEEDRKALLATSVQMLEYDRALQTDPRLEPFRWHSTYLFPWSAFVHVIVELCHEEDLVAVEKLWKLVHTVYETCPELVQADNDKRKVYTAGLIIEAWSYLQALRSTNNRSLEKPPKLLSVLESLLADSAAERQSKKRKADGELPLPTQAFEDIDWAFWTLPPGAESLDNFVFDI